jgi:uncharacterized protein (TIGR00369 family)
MNDKPAAARVDPFDPAGAGWEIFPNTAFGELVGPIWQRKAGDALRFGFVVAKKHLNRAGILHGGMLMTLADQSMAIAARHATGSKRHATIELTIQFVGGVQLGEFVEARPALVRATRSLTFMEAKMFVGERLVVATNGIWKILDEG